MRPANPSTPESRLNQSSVPPRESGEGARPHSLFDRTHSASFFQAVATAPGATDVLDLARSNPIQGREHFRNERHQV